MALIKCKECGHKISSKATSCPQCGNPTKKKSSSAGLCGCLVIVALIGVVGVAYMGKAPDTPAEPSTQQTRPHWKPALGNIWTGVKLYYGAEETKMYVGEILGGNDDYVDPITGLEFRGVKIRMKDGQNEWKDRDAIVRGSWHVKSDDPALQKMEWYEYRR